MKNKILRGSFIYTLMSIIIGFIVGGIFLAVAHISPTSAYGALYDGIFGKLKYISWSIMYASPLILTGLSVAFAFKTGVFNIGAEGQFVVGSLAACLVGIFVDVPAIIHIPLALVAAVAAGALWGAIVGYLKVKSGVNEILSYIMFNWIAFYLSNYVVNIPAVHRTGTGEATKDVLPSARILAPEFIRKATKLGTFNWGIVIAIILAIVTWFVINKTTLGFKLRAVGYSKSAAKYAGINTKKMFLTAMCISGALAGLGGAVQTLGMSGRISQFASQEQFGFQGITVALIASSNPIGCIFAGLFYGAMKYGGTKLSLVSAPSEVVDIIMGTIIIFIAVSHVFKYLFTEKLSKNNKKGGK